MKRTTLSAVAAAAAGVVVACGSPDASGPRADLSASLDGGGSASSSVSPEPDASLADAHAPADAAGDARTIDADAAAGDSSIEGAADASTINACGYSQCASRASCADLTIDQQEMAQSVVISTQDFATNSCEVVERCIVTPGTRRLLRFDLATVNVGTADLVLGAPITEACFKWSDCHGHYHFQGFAKYTLYRSDGVTVAAVGHKQAFCLEDVEPSPRISPTPPTPLQPFDCTHQGIHVGWEDVYPNDVPCQWVDITGVPPGDYVLSAIVNAAGSIPELDFANNEARVPVTIP